LLPFFEHYNWGHKCCTSVIMNNSHSIQKISKWPKTYRLQEIRLILKDFWFANFSQKHISFTWQPQKSL
jgi:hypothetical protein